MHIQDAVLENELLKNMFSKIPKSIEDRCFVKCIDPLVKVLNKDEEIESVYFLCKGSMRVISEFANGTVHGFAYVDPGDIIGAMEILSNHKTSSSTLETLTECVFITMSVQDFKEWFEANHEFAKFVARMIATKFYPTSHDYGVVFKDEASVALARYILKSVKTEIKNNGVVDVKMTRQYLAEELGVSVRTIYRNLNKLSDKGCLVINSGVIQLGEKEFNNIKEYLKLGK